MDDRHRFDELCDFMETHEFTIEDMLAIICANLCRNPEKEFETKMLVGGHEFEIKIVKKGI